MDISEEKRIADATAKEIAELESLKKRATSWCLMRNW